MVRRKTTYEILTCECGEKYITDPEVMDNVYYCLNDDCGKDLTQVRPMRYTLDDNELCKLIEAHFEGKLAEAYTD